MYGIMRVKKIKSIYSLSASLRHSYREQPTPNADPSKASQNRFAGAKTVNQALARYEDRKATIKGKIRSNAVMALEYMIGASPEFFKTASKADQKRFFNDSLNWLKDQYGAENVVCAGIHYDEKTPHMWVYVIPLKDQKLNARHYIGGNKQRLSDLQTDFHNKCCASQGLERGVQGSKVRHTEIRHWYAVMREVLDLPKQTKSNKIKMILSGGLDEIIQGAAASAAEARQAVEKAKRAVEISRAAQKRAESVTERLAASEKLISMLEMEKARNEAMLEKMSGLQELVDRNKDLLRDAEAKRFGIKLEPVEPAIQPDPNPTAPPAPPAQLTL